MKYTNPTIEEAIQRLHFYYTQALYASGNIARPTGLFESRSLTIFSAAIGIQNGFYSLLRSITISRNNNEVKHNREPLFTTTF